MGFSSGTTRTLQKEVERLPEAEGAAYLKALRENVNVVDRETPESRFLAVADGDSRNAALRLANYWTTRVELFGERAFLPLDQTGTGALDDKTIEMVATGALVCPPKDTTGRPVVAFHQPNFLPYHLESDYDDVRLRYAFYMFSLTTENPIAQSLGISIMCSLTGSLRAQTHRKMIHVIRNCLPIRRVQFHVIFRPSTLGMIGRISWSILDLYQSALPADRFAIVHREDTDEETLRSLISHGFELSAIPAWFGGLWTTRDFENWRSRRLDVERQRKMTETEKLRQRRALDAERARNRRKRRQLESDLLQRQVNELVLTKKALERESERLFVLLNCAKELLLLHRR